LNLGLVLRACGKLDAAIDRYSKALRLKPDFAEAFNNLGNALKDQGRLVKAMECFKKALQLKPEVAHVHSNLLLSLNYCHDIKPDQLFSQHKQWYAQHAVPLATTIQIHLNSRLRDRHLRIGYVSPDFRMHSVAYFIEPVLTLHDRAAFEIFCYSDLVRPDSVTHRLKNLEVHWRDIFGMSDEQASKLIRDDQIDILIDLAGHTSGNRMLLFARKPAPIQVTYLGYPSSTGLSTMDHRITDSWADPPGQTEQFYTEKLVRLPHGFLCYKPPEYAPEITKPSVLKAEGITFGSFNHRAKITPIVVKLWSEILTSLPNVKLVLKSRSLSDNGTQNLLLEMLLKNGVSPERVKFVGYIPSLLEHLELYNSIDIGLDTFPYNGTTTTCEAMWMGTPVIVLSGQNHISRVGVSLLSNIGLTELIAESTEDYLEKAIKLAGDLKRLQKLQAGLRDMMLRSSLTDDHQFIHALEDVYRKMWLSWLDEDKKV
jgi:protein O-GlcNAc transferase